MFASAGLVTDKHQRIDNAIVNAVESAFFSNIDGHVGPYTIMQHNGNQVAVYYGTDKDYTVLGGRQDILNWLRLKLKEAAAVPLP